MKKPGSIFKTTLLIFLLILLVIPFLQETFNYFKERPLAGAITAAENKYFSLKSWFSGEYQVNKEKYLNESFGFRKTFVRLNNQVSFSLFHVANAKSVIVGKNNYLYEEAYIKTYLGEDYIGKDSILHRMQKLKFISDTLTKLNKNIILVFAAGKGTFYPEYFPDEYRKQKTVSNYELYVNYAKSLKLNYIDFNEYFKENKNTSKYPLYPKYGIHWSYYGACLAADSIIKYIEKLRNIDMPHIFWKKINMDYANEADYDIGYGLNLLFKLKRDKMAYPLLHYESDSGKTKPSVIVISDSFYWILFNFGISNCFSKSHFWYYNKQVYPESYKKPLETGQLNLIEEINKHDVIIIMASEINLINVGWGFIEQAYKLYGGK